VGFFENKLLSARLSYSYRSQFFVSFDRTTHLDEAALKELDAIAGRECHREHRGDVRANNLTDEKIIQFADVESHPRAIYDNGRVYFFGAKARF